MDKVSEDIDKEVHEITSLLSKYDTDEKKLDEDLEGHMETSRESIYNYIVEQYKILDKNDTELIKKTIDVDTLMQKTNVTPQEKMCRMKKSLRYYSTDSAF